MLGAEESVEVTTGDLAFKEVLVSGRSDNMMKIVLEAGV